MKISLKERGIYSRAQVKKDIERMLTLYQRSGRLSTEINPTIQELFPKQEHVMKQSRSHAQLINLNY